MRVLQLNINGGNYWDSLISFLMQNDFDILQLQELSGKGTKTGVINTKFDAYEKLQAILKDTYDAELTIAQRYSSNSTAYMGNATFFKKKFHLLQKREIVISTHAEPFPSDATAFEGVGRKMLQLILEIENKRISFINTHLAWAKTPKEELHQTEQGEKVVSFLKTVASPFVLSGDFNLSPTENTIQKINTLARNLTKEYHITNTLNPKNHRAKELFPSGVSVDYIYTSFDLEIKNFGLITEDISDHFGLFAEIVL